MEFLDARRLTGPSLLADGPGTILDVSCNDAEGERLIADRRPRLGRTHRDDADRGSVGLGVGVVARPGEDIDVRGLDRIARINVGAAADV